MGKYCNRHGEIELWGFFSTSKQRHPCCRIFRGGAEDKVIKYFLLLVKFVQILAAQLQQAPRTIESSNAAHGQSLPVPLAASSLLMVVNKAAKKRREGKRQAEFLLRYVFLFLVNYLLVT